MIDAKIKLQVCNILLDSCSWFRPGSGQLSSVVLLYPLRIRWRKVSGLGSSAARSHRIVVQVNCVCFPSWLTWASHHNDPASWKLALKNIFLVKKKKLVSFHGRKWYKARPENYQFTTEEAESKKVFPENLGNRIRDNFTYFSGYKNRLPGRRGRDRAQRR